MAKIREKSIAMVKWECSGCGHVYGVQKNQLSQHKPETSCWRCKAKNSISPGVSATPEKKG